MVVACIYGLGALGGSMCIDGWENVEYVFHSW